MTHGRFYPDGRVLRGDDDDGDDEDRWMAPWVIVRLAIY